MAKQERIESTHEIVILPSNRKFSDFKTMSYNLKGDQDTIRRFNYEHIPEKIRDILETFPNVVLAGGSLISNINSHEGLETDEQDYDLFIIGGENWDTVRALINLFEGLTVEIGCGLININFDTPWQVPGPVQIIMSNYNSVEDVLNSFDLEQCKLAFCAGKFYMTELAEQANIHRVIPIDRIFRMTATRINKYITRGFGVATLHYSPVTRINDLHILYTEVTADSPNVMVVSSKMLTQENVGERNISPYSMTYKTEFDIKEPELIPFILFTSRTLYIPEINYGSITWREYLNHFCFDYENYELEFIYEKWYMLSLIRNIKITRDFVSRVHKRFYESLDKKINFWIETFNNGDIPVTIEF